MGSGLQDFNSSPSVTNHLRTICNPSMIGVPVPVMKDHSQEGGVSKDRIPALEAEVRQLRLKLHKDYPAATPAQLEAAIGNALKATNQSLDQERVEKITRHHLGEPDRPGTPPTP